MSERIRNVTLAFTSSLVALALGEAFLRLTAGPPPAVHIELPDSRDRVEPQELTLEKVPDQGGLYVPSPFGLRLRPNTHAVIQNERLSGKTIDIRTNSLGYRGPEVSSRPGTRILFLGDSITFASYLAEEETFVHLVGELAAEKHRTWNTINTGVGTIGLANEVAILKDTGLSVDPDVVVLDFYLNDFMESPGVFLVRVPDWSAWSWAAHHAAVLLGRLEPPEDLTDTQNTIWPQLAARSERASGGDWRTDPRAFAALVYDWRTDWGAAWAEHAWVLMRPFFEELARLAAARGFRLVFVAMPVSHQVDAAFVDDWPQQRLAAIGRELGVPVLDLLPALRAEAANGQLFYDQCHHTAFGSRVVARAIADFLADVLPSP